MALESGARIGCVGRCESKKGDIMSTAFSSLDLYFVTKCDSKG